MFGTASSASINNCLRKEDRDGEVLIARDGHIYKLSGVLGKGGLSTVYRAIRFADGEVVALKIAETGKAAEASELLRKEAALLRRMNHTHIVKLLDEGVTREGDPFIVLEILPGQTLEQVLHDQTKLPVKRAVNICLQVAAALQYAHSRGVIHKDIKPANIMIIDTNYGDRVVLYDFGIAANVECTGLCHEESSSGSLMYAAPEQLDESPCSYSTDVYQLALVLFQLLTGRLPFELSVAAAVRYRRSGPLLGYDCDSDDPVFTDRLRRVVESALKRDPAERTGNIHEFATGVYKCMLERFGPRAMAQYPDIQACLV